MDYRIQEVIKTMKMLDESAKRMPMAHLDRTAVQDGLSLSKRVCAQEEYVFATPWMKNLLISCGDVKQTFDEKSQEWKTEKLKTGQKSKAVDLVNRWVKAALLKYCGPEREEYNEDLPISSIEHLKTDCWLGWKEKVWDIQPGQAEERKKVFRLYTQERTNFSVQELIKRIQVDEALQKAILAALEILPEVRASREVTAISDPFMSKGTGVSYPDYKNDRTAATEGETYGRRAIRLTQEAADKGIDALERYAYENNVYTGYPRNQRGKGRALEAQSRRTNLVVNLVNSPEMEKWKSSPVLQTAFLDEAGIKANLVKMAEWVEQHPDFIARNEDTSGWDRSVGAGWITLSGALRYLRANGNYTKKLVEIRHNCARKAWFVDGPNNKVSIMYGRTPSGYDDTTLLNSSIHYVLGDSANMSADPTYSEQVIYPTHYCNQYIVGDDIVTIMRKGPEAVKAFREYYKSMGYTIHSDEKSIFGVMFIQYRVFRDPKTNEWLMSYNWPRVFRSMLSKETAKQLGVGGWTLSAYQQLGKLIEYPEFCKIPLNFICACDQYKLNLNTPIDKLKVMVKDEDEKRVKAAAERRTQKLNRTLTTAERLSNNPTLPGYITGDDGKVEIDWDYFGAIQAKLRAMYDENFLPALGFENPDLSGIH